MGSGQTAMWLTWSARVRLELAANVEAFLGELEHMSKLWRCLPRAPQ